MRPRQLKQKPKKRYKLFAGSLLIILTSILVTRFATSSAFVSYTDAFSSIASVLPDDQYDRCLPQYSSAGPSTDPSQPKCNLSHLASAQDCKDSHIYWYPGQVGNYHWGCDSGNYQYFAANGTDINSSHQYITLSNDTINDNTSTGNWYAQKIDLDIYTKSPLSEKDIGLVVADRGVGDQYACGTKVHLFYYKDNGLPITSSSGSDDHSLTTKQSNCDGFYHLSSGSDNNGNHGDDAFPSNTMDQGGPWLMMTDSNGQPTGIYRAKLSIVFDKNNANKSQISFHVEVNSNDARLGYMNADSNTTPNSPLQGYQYPNDHGWVNSYPSNLQHLNKVRYYFRPECTTQAGTPFDIEWYDTNEGDQYIQESNAKVTVYRFHPGEPDSTMERVPGVASTTDLSDGNFVPMIQMKTQNYHEGQPYAYMVEFDNINGGNGISFRYPFDAANARIPCPPPPQPTPASAMVTCNNVTVADETSHTVGSAHYPTRTLILGWGLDDPGDSPPLNGNIPIIISGNAGVTRAYATSHTFSFTSTGRDDGNKDDVHLELARQYTPDGGKTWIGYSNGTDPGTVTNDNGTYKIDQYSHKCHNASCEVTVIGEKQPENIVAWGNGYSGKYTLQVKITNTGGLDTSVLTPTLEGHDLSFTYDNIPHKIDQTLYQNGGFTVLSLDQSTDNKGSPYTASTPDGYPDYYYGIGPIGGHCSVNFDVYYYFNIDPSAVFNGTDWENPTTVSYVTSGTKTEGPDVNATASSSLTRNDLTVDGHTASHTYGIPPSTTDTYSWNPPNVNIGDKYCASVTISPGRGYKGVSSIVAPEDVSADSGCQRVVNEPYVHFFGSDVTAGGRFGSSNCAVGGAVSTYLDTNDPANPRGSGVQFGAEALYVIEGFRSASLRVPPPNDYTGLTFANHGVDVSGGTPNGKFGGRYGVSNNCVPDYYQNYLNKHVTAPSYTGSIGTTPGQYPYSNNGNLTIDGDLTVNNGVNAAIYVDGNVYIKGNIRYAGAGSWAHVADIPSLFIVAKGNVYIDPHVTQLDGVYVAEGSDQKSGKIDTCTPNGSPVVSADGLYGSGNICGYQLTVNGAFVAGRVKLNRTYSSLRFGHKGESGVYPVHNCGNAGSDMAGSGTPTNAADCAAEIFNFSPELFLSRPASKPTHGPATNKYDAITSLSPVL